MKLAVGSTLMLVLRCNPSQSFVASYRTSSVTKESRSLKRPRAQSALRHQRQQLAMAGSVGEDWEGRLLELDVVEYRMVEQDEGRGEESIELGSYVGNGKVQPLLTREESGPHLFFHDEDAQPFPVSGGSCQIVRVVDEVYYSQRIIEDRVKNPHGEEAEDCFLLEGPLNPALVIRVEHNEG